RDIQQHIGVIAKLFDSYTISARKTVRGRDQCVALPASDDLVTYTVDEVTGVGKYRIEPSLKHLLLQGFAVAFGNLHVDLWVRHNKVFGNKRHPKWRHRGVAADVQGSNEFIGSVAHFLLHICRTTHELAGIGQESAARRRQSNAMGSRAHHELLTNRTLQLVERLRHRSLRDVNLLCSSGDRSGVSSGNEVLQLPQSEAKRIHKYHTNRLGILTVLQLYLVPLDAAAPLTQNDAATLKIIDPKSDTLRVETVDREDM